MASPATIIEQAIAVRAVAITFDDVSETITIRTVHLPTAVSLNPAHGLQIVPGQVEQLLGSRQLRTQWLHGNDWVLVALDGTGGRWRLRGLGPYRGPGLIVGWTVQGDAVADAAIDTEVIAGWLELEEGGDVGDELAEEDRDEAA